MPTYTFKCLDEKCNNVFDIIKTVQEMENEEITICPKCGNKEIKRIFSVPVFKNNLGDCCGRIGK